MVNIAMFRRLCCFVIAFCSLFSFALAEIRYVDNGPQWDARLNLREGPSKSTASLGLYYTGVRVQVLEELDGWCRVRIATGESSSPVEGYMMSSYLSAAWLGACQLPYGIFDGKFAYVMAYGSQYLHVLYEDGTTGYVYHNGATFVPPLPQEQLLMERICTAEGGAILTDSTGNPIAALHGGVTLDGSLVFADRSRALAGLGDTNDEVRGLLTEGWTWVDNGANCAVQYDVYEGKNGLIEVLGTMTDGRTILRTTSNGIDKPQVALVHDFTLDGLIPLQHEGSYFRYVQPLTDEPTDDELLRRVCEQLDFQTLSALADCTAQVERLMDFQYRHRMIRVIFTDPNGQFAGMAEYVNGRIMWTSEDNG